MISLAITVCNEHEELTNLLDFLQEHALSPQYEIIIQIDEHNHTPEVVSTIIDRGIKHHFFPLNNDFAAYKNELAKHCSGDYIFQVDADEIPSAELLSLLPMVLSSNSQVDVYLVPRINTVSGITEEHITRWGWKVENDRINFPDYQWRIYKNIPEIQWINKVHERLDGFKVYSMLPAQDDFCLLHPKTIERQERQNHFYNTL